MRILLATLMIMFVACCGAKDKHKSKPPSEDELIGKMNERAELYLKLVDVDEKGWVKDTKCDGLLFNSLFSLGGGKPQIEEAKQEPGLWFRHHLQDCYSGNRSGSTISRDMFSGLYLWMWHHKRLDLINEIIEYGQDHTNSLGGWVMGEGDKFRISIRGGGQANLYEMRYRLGGSSHPMRNFPQTYPPVTGYEAHLQTLTILLRGLVMGGISDGELRVLGRNAGRVPGNALFDAVYHQFSDGNRRGAIRSLLNENLFPKERLPGKRDRCSEYIFQREQYSRDGAVKGDWLPCEETSAPFSGTDFLFARAVILRLI